MVNSSKVTAFVNALTNKFALINHSHAISDVTNLQTTIDGKASTSHTHTKSEVTDFPTLATVATSGSYSDLSNKPTIPSKTSDLSNDSNFATTTNVSDSITAHNSNTSAHNLNKSQNIAFGTVGGTTSAFTVSLTGVTLTEGTVIALYNAIGNNVANATLNVNGLGAKPLYNQASAIPASRFPNKSVCLFVYNTTIVSTGCWQIIYSYGANTTYNKATTTPIADTSAGAVGTINKYALADHSHPQSSLYAEASHSHTKSQITDFPTIPSSSSDLSDGSSLVKTSNTSGLLKNDGTVMQSGTGASNYSAGNHTHSGYANSTHNHNITDLNNVSTVNVTVTYTNNTTETIKLMKYTGS